MIIFYGYKIRDKLLGLKKRTKSCILIKNVNGAEQNERRNVRYNH